MLYMAINNNTLPRGEKRGRECPSETKGLVPSGPKVVRSGLEIQCIFFVCLQCVDAKKDMSSPCGKSLDQSHSQVQVC